MYVRTRLYVEQRPCPRSRVDTHHQQVATGHTDDADVGEGLQDVLQRGGGEGEHLLGRVGRNTLLHHLKGGRGRGGERERESERESE